MTIVVGYAPGGRGRPVLHLAAMLARSAGEDLVVCAVVPTPWPPSPGPAVLEGMARAAVERARERLPEGVVAETVVDHARSVAVGLLEAAAARNASAVVIGRSGQPSIGSVTARLLHSSPIPVALAPHAFRCAPGSRVARVTVGYGGSEPVVDAARALAGRVGAPLRIASFMVLPAAAGEKAHERIAREVEAAFPDTPVTIGHGESWEEAIDDVEWSDRDVMVLGSSSTGPLDRVFLGSRASRIIRHTPVPVIVMPAR
jgi:nucleotide-binding universal stress UspA family protein